mmetsp:Transcript_21292/g.50364  ORF Transcript_21292/g.50364 Transcript_21292/m.50364 type:complete len:305 (+) Transcript_21292:185-1099(+)
MLSVVEIGCDRSIWVPSGDGQSGRHYDSTSACTVPAGLSAALQGRLCNRRWHDVRPCRYILFVGLGPRRHVPGMGLRRGYLDGRPTLGSQHDRTNHEPTRCSSDRHAPGSGLPASQRLDQRQAHLPNHRDTGIVARNDRGGPQDRAKVLHRDCRERLRRADASQARIVEPHVRSRHAVAVGRQECGGRSRGRGPDEPAGRHPERTIQDRSRAAADDAFLMEGAGVEVCDARAGEKHDRRGPARGCHNFLHRHADSLVPAGAAAAAAAGAAAVTMVQPHLRGVGTVPETDIDRPGFRTPMESVVL